LNQRINQGPYVEALRQGLRDLRYVEGRNIAIEYRGAEGKTDRYPTLVNQLVQKLRSMFSSSLLYQQFSQPMPDAVTKLLIEKNVITEAEFKQKLLEERAVYQRILNQTTQ
jgi:hypothetical protein